MKKPVEERLLWKETLPGAAAGMVNGLFGGGGGLLMVPLLRHLTGIELHKAHATTIVTTACLSAISLAVYLFHGAVDWELALPLALGGIAGSAAGALWLNKIPTEVLRKGFALFLIVSAGRMYVR